KERRGDACPSLDVVTEHDRPVGYAKQMSDVVRRIGIEALSYFDEQLREDRVGVDLMPDCKSTQTTSGHGAFAYPDRNAATDPALGLNLCRQMQAVSFASR